MKKHPIIFKNKLEVDRTGVEFQRFNVLLGDTNQFHILSYSIDRGRNLFQEVIYIYIYRNPIVHRIWHFKPTFRLMFMQNVTVNIPYMDDTIGGRNPAPVETYKPTLLRSHPPGLCHSFVKGSFCWSLVTKRWRPILKLPSTFAFWRPVIKSRCRAPGCGTAEAVIRSTKS